MVSVAGAGNWVLLEGLDATITKTATVVPEFLDEEVHIIRPLQFHTQVCSWQPFLSPSTCWSTQHQHWRLPQYVARSWNRFADAHISARVCRQERVVFPGFIQVYEDIPCWM